MTSGQINDEKYMVYYRSGELQNNILLKEVFIMKEMNENMVNTTVNEEEKVNTTVNEEHTTDTKVETPNVETPVTETVKLESAVNVVNVEPTIEPLAMGIAGVKMVGTAFKAGVKKHKKKIIAGGVAILGIAAAAFVGKQVLDNRRLEAEAIDRLSNSDANDDDNECEYVNTTVEDVDTEEVNDDPTVNE